MSSTRKKAMPMLVTCLVAGTVLAVLGPLGTHTFSPLWRLIYWVGLCLIGGLGAGMTDVIAGRLGKDLKNWQYALWQSITASLAVGGFMLAVALFTSGVPNPIQYLSMLFYIWVISAAISLIGALIRKGDNAQNNLPARASLYERLAPKLRTAEIYALAAEDHYVKVMTSKGDELVLMRLSDATRETTPLKGLSPHRSWWVAEAGVETIQKSEITLKNGQTVPISRNGMKLVREAGWN